MLLTILSLCGCSSWLPSLITHVMCLHTPDHTRHVSSPLQGLTEKKLSSPSYFGSLYTFHPASASRMHACKGYCNFFSRRRSHVWQIEQLLVLGIFDQRIGCPYRMTVWMWQQKFYGIAILFLGWIVARPICIPITFKSQKKTHAQTVI